MGFKSFGMRLAALILPIAGLPAPIAAHKEAELANAVQRGDTQAVLSLLKKHADVNATQGDGVATLANVPVPIGRNYQMLFVTLPGVSPP
jgi:hypothetical protein